MLIFVLLAFFCKMFHFMAVLRDEFWSEIEFHKVCDRKSFSFFFLNHKLQCFRKPFKATAALIQNLIFKIVIKLTKFGFRFFQVFSIINHSFLLRIIEFYCGYILFLLYYMIGIKDRNQQDLARALNNKKTTGHLSTKSQ